MGERCAKEHKADAFSSGLPVNLVPTICGKIGLIYIGGRFNNIGVDSIILYKLRYYSIYDRSLSNTSKLPGV